MSVVDGFLSHLGVADFQSFTSHCFRRGAGVDVFEEEPTPADHPLFTCDQAIVTPHCADMTPEGVDLLNGGAVDNVIAYLEGNPQNRVT